MGENNIVNNLDNKINYALKLFDALNSLNNIHGYLNYQFWLYNSYKVQGLITDVEYSLLKWYCAMDNNL